ncbi:unnamed protein product [Parnassius apollo]|uniref:Lipase n=1 Tax=Parnassius apollo TaxID=110799 RepID=A0A8S3XUA7_PARAO|nr:unnamed protein product [Parnassius apollo]
MRQIIVLLVCCVVLMKNRTAQSLGKDRNVSFPELASKYGYTTELYDAFTEDGYILRLFRIPGVRKVPILLMHGILDSADTWIIRGNTSLAITLANQGYDVWLGNCRGNRYSRRHIYLDPNVDDDFWDFSFHEYGFYDLAAIINTVLYITDVERLDAIGHSQGTTIFYVLGSTRPEYNQKVNVIVSLAPVCYLQNVPPPLETVIQYSPIIYNLLKSLHVQEVFEENEQKKKDLKALCVKPLIGYAICIYDIMFPITGYDAEELEADFLPIFFDHFPTSTSVKNLYHFAQVGYRRQFARFDYGVDRNLDMYGYPNPPKYELENVKMRVALFVGANDFLSTVEDVAILKQNLPNVVRHLVIPRRKMNHADFAWGLHMNEYLYPYIFDVLNTYASENVSSDMSI